MDCVLISSQSNQSAHLFNKRNFSFKLLFSISVFARTTSSSSCSSSRLENFSSNCFNRVDASEEPLEEDSFAAVCSALMSFCWACVRAWRRALKKKSDSSNTHTLCAKMHHFMQVASSRKPSYLSCSSKRFRSFSESSEAADTPAAAAELFCF